MTGLYLLLNKLLKVLFGPTGDQVSETLIFFFRANTPRPLNRRQRLSSVFEHPLITCDVDQQSYTLEQQQFGNSSICMSFLTAMFTMRKLSRNGWRRSKTPPRYTLVRTVKDTRHAISVVLDGQVVVLFKVQMMSTTLHICIVTPTCFPKYAS